MREMRESSGSIRLGKDTTNLFRSRTESPTKKLDVRDFNSVIKINVDECWVDVEGMTTYEALVNETLKKGFMPAVVPELKSITIGGAVSGLGIEASSFRFGLVHETVLEMDILLSSGHIVTATPDNQHRDLFFGMPNSFGTLGYVVRVRALLIPVKPYVRITHERFVSPKVFLETLVAYTKRDDIDFLESEIFSDTEHYISTGSFTNTASHTSDYTYMHIYYRSIRKNSEDFLTTHDFIWRWDTDWFWDSKFFGAEYKIVRRLLGKKRLNSKFYMRLMQLSRRWNLYTLLDFFRKTHSEAVIQDIPIPAENASDFLAFFQKEIGITPLWICPIGTYHTDRRYPLFPTDRSKLYFNFGFWDTVKNRGNFESGHFNKLVEKKANELGGIKSLYSDSYYSEKEFWGIYGKESYQVLKKKYDPVGKLKDLYEKCVQKA